MEEERSSSSLRRGGSLSRLASNSRLANSTFVSRQRQLLEGHAIEGGEVKKGERYSPQFQQTLKSEALQNSGRCQGVEEDSPRSDVSTRSDLSDKILQVAHEIVKATDQVINHTDGESSNLGKTDGGIGNAVGSTSGSRREAEICNSFGFTDTIVDSPGTRRKPIRNVLVKSRTNPNLNDVDVADSQHPRQQIKDRFKTSTPKHLPSEIARKNRQVIQSLRERPLSAGSYSSRQQPYIKSTPPAGLDTSLKLSLKGLSDSDEDDIEDFDDKQFKDNEATGKLDNFALRDNQVEVNSPFANRRDSDSSIVNETSSKHIPVIKQGLKLKTFSNESLSETSVASNEVVKTLKRTSSGRKLPIPNSKPIRPLKTCDSESSFLSILKDGSTEYVALDLPKSSSFGLSSKSDQLKDINGVETTMNSTSKSSVKKSADRQGVGNNILSVGHEGKTNVKSPSGDRTAKPPLERKSSRGVIPGAVPSSPRKSVASPRKVLAASPRKPASPRVSGSPRVSNSPRGLQPSPRGIPIVQARASPRDATDRTTPRGHIDRKSSRENLKTVDNTDHRKRQTGNSQSEGALQNGTNVEVNTRRRTLSGGSLVSPRPGSPLKGRSQLVVNGALQGSRIEEEPVPSRPRLTRQDSCQQMDLQQAIDTFRVQDSLVSQARSETEVQSEKTWMDAERVWLVHKGGFASASQLRGEGHGVPEGRVKIRLDHGGEILEVDEDDVEKTNPPQLDRAEDLALLRFLNESSSLHTVRQRYGGNLIHTYGGPSLIIVNPMQPLQIYSEKVIQMFKGCKQEDMPPHIFASAQIAYREMLNTRQDQSLVLTGRSGGGKSYNAHHLLHYLATSAGSVGGVLTVDKLNAVTVLLEAFGNSRTILNTSASRFAQLTTMDFDHNGQIVSAAIQVLLFEKTRVVRRPEGEPTFHVFYQLLAGVDSKLRSELQLNNLSDPNLFMTPLQKAEDKQRAMQYWARIYAAMEKVGMTEEEIRSICSVLAAIYHLGVAGASKGNNNKGQFARPAGAQKAASLLGISPEELARNIFSSSGTATLGRTTSMRNSPADKGAEANTTAMEALEGFVIGLYSDVFNAIVSLINRSLSSNFRSMSSITVVDSPGFQNPATCGRQTGASFEDLCHNYTQEKLQLLFHELVFTTPQDRYSQENIECDFEFVTTSPAAMVSLIEKPSQQSLGNFTRGNNEKVKPHLCEQIPWNGLQNNDMNDLKRPSSYYEDTNHSHSVDGTTRSSEQYHRSTSNPSFNSKIPVKVTSLKCNQHLNPTSPTARNQHGNHFGDHEEVRTSTPEVREAEKKGLLWILDEEAIFPGATEDTFMERFFTYHGEQKVKRDSLLRKASSLGNTFILNHFQGTNPVQYNASGWLKVCRENPIAKVATQVLQDSKKGNIKELFNSVKAPVGGLVSGSIVGMEGSNTLRRVGSMRRTFMSGTAGLKKRSMCLQVKFQVDTIIETLRKTKCHFIHCLLPQANAGLCELRSTAEQTQDDILMNVPLVRAQFRGNEILESVRIHRQGFPDHIPFGEFIQKFEGLVPPGVRPTPDMNEKSAVLQIIENLDIDKLNYRIGLSKVFFRAGALNRLESSRDDRVTGRITAFQAYCRGYTARKRLEKLRVQHVAISCIQKNVRKFYQIRDWDWWKLYVKVKPLLNVHRTEEELHDKELELETMKTKLERVERERSEYKLQMEKMENRVVELTADLAEENTTATQASEMLETENAERMRLEKELKDIQGRYNALKRTHDKLEMEMSQMRLWQAETLDGELEEDEVDGGIYKERYDKIRREMAMSKRQIQQQHEDEMEQEHSAKKVLEKRLHEALEDSDDIRRQLAAAKKKAQKLMLEMQDSKLHLEEQMARNNDLERKQRRFDTELSKAHDESRTEKQMKEKLQRERETLAADKYSLEKEVERLKGDVESSESKYERIQKELGDTLTSVGVKDDHEVAALKRAKADLEAKVIDQEEELDDQAGQIQQLEQAKVRLEMSLEKARQQSLKDVEEKDQEMEDLRFSTQKKLKQMESQIEEEYEERKLMVQKTRDLEQRLHDLQGQAALRDKDAEKRLRRDLRRTKALLRDAELVLQKQKTGEGSKAQVRQLRNQLEDLEFSSAAAIKAKKTMELELADLQQQLDDLFKSKQETENKSMSLLREKTELQSQLEENEEDLGDAMKKYKAVVQQQSLDHITLNDQLQQIEELTVEKDKLRSEVNDLKSRVQTYEENSVDKTVVQRLENKIRDLETRLELETTNKHRLEVQVTRTKEQYDRTNEEKEQLGAARIHAEENIKRVQRQLRDLREEFSDVQKREMEMAHKYKENENKVAELEGDFEQNQSDLKLAFKRISDLQAALEEGIDTDFSDR
ncbi:unconventional myosin-XVIIIa-like isoform X4 [Mya arenaria]|uniref:unconventional myosin-XVIIIa-like isoform X4 n=1 Tax=Mya arenaria TaxID=6604 RepID=UPI0022E3A911|nr:unconventional myosin-XVIIIa-like isoform X4 [Mya arenaria]